MTWVIGLTGGIASGKSHISGVLAQAGVPVVDADRISRALTAPGGAGLPAVRAAFGDAFFQGGELDRRALGRLVFSDGEALARLNAALHPLILAQIREELSALRAENVPVCVLDAPLLFEAGLDALCDETWCVWIPQKTQLKRLRERDGLSYREAYARIRSQMPAAEKKRRAGFVIDNRGAREQSAALALARLEAVRQEKTAPSGGKTAEGTV